MYRLLCWKELFLDLLFPRRCVGCGAEGSLLCGSCLETSPRIEPPFCPRCGEPAKVETLCARCRQGLWALDGLRSLFPFQGVIRRAIHALKYENIRALAAPLSQLLEEYLRAHPMSAEILIPVPLHLKQLHRRGYNQAALLAQRLSGLAQLTLEENYLVRWRDTPPQARIPGAEERRVNISGAFRCRDRRHEGAHILLLDDVCTTGSTLEACADALKEAGAASVWGLTLARETNPG